MTDRVNIKTQEDVRDRLKSLKREGETWDGLFGRMIRTMEGAERRGGQLGAPTCVRCGDGATTWTVEEGSAICEDCSDVDFDDGLPAE